MTNFRILPVFSLLLSAASLTGCAHALARYSSGQIGCPPDEITISDDRRGWGNRTWTAECRGRTYFCTGSDEDISCRARDEAVSASSAPAAPAAAPARPAAAATSSVQRHVRDGRALFVAEASAGSTTLRFMTSPANDAESARISLPASAASAADCPAGLLIDGAVESLPLLRATPQEIMYSMTMDALRRAAAAQHLSGRICADELVFDADDIASLRELVRRTDEEVAWTNAQAAPPVAPAPAAPTTPAP